MKPHAPKRQRCAIYTRKSTEHNLDLAFNSLDAQREACEAYIKSQAHEGWTLIKDHFDDGGLSGASLERPALQKLLERVRAQDVDVIVVYKVDRLTRSLADFAKLVEEFDAHDVSFVSVTQSFNTTSSMGRLTLNVLLSFAQFEREVIGERVRDKIAASKRKGMWMGGYAPLGYCAKDKKLVVEPEEAERVKRIFAEYLRLGSVAELAEFLGVKGIGPRGDAQKSEARAARFGVGALFHLLRNHTYVGEVAYRGEVYPGEHEAIVDRELFEAVQQKLGDQAVERRWIRKTSPSLLSGKLFDDRGNAMTPSHANKKGVRYRYYVSQALLQGRKSEAGSVARVSASDVERAVLAGLRQTVNADGDAPIASDADDLSAVRASHRDLIERCVARAVVRRTEITLELKSEEAKETVDVDGDASNEPTSKVVSIPFVPTQAPRKGVAYAPSSDRSMSESERKTLLMAIARSRAWARAITRGETDFATIAAQENLVERHVRFLAPLAYLSPRIVEAIAEGRARGDLTASGLARNLPLSWREQERRIGLV